MKTDTTLSHTYNILRPESSPVRDLAASVKSAQATGETKVLEAARVLRVAGQEAAVQEQSLPPQQTPTDQAALDKAVTRMNDYVQNIQRDLRFEVDEDLGRTIISVVDSDTHEVIRQIPPETVLERARRLQEENPGEGFLLTEQA